MLAVSSGPRNYVANTGYFVRVHDAATSVERWSVRVDDEYWAGLVSFSADGRRLLYTIIKRWRVGMLHAESGAPLGTLPGLTYFPAFSPDNRFVAGISATTVSVFDAFDLALRYQVSAGRLPSLAGPVFSPDSTLMLVGELLPVGNQPTTMWALDTETGDLHWTMTHASHENTPGYVNMAAFSRDGKRVVTAGEHGATVFELGAVVTERYRLTHQGPVRAVVFARDGAAVATASADKNARVFAMSTGLENAHRTHDAAVNAVEFTADGQAVLTGSDDGTAGLFSTATADERLSRGRRAGAHRHRQPRRALGRHRQRGRDRTNHQPRQQHPPNAQPRRCGPCGSVHP